MQITPELILLRTALASPSLRPGAVVAARVLDRGVLSLLGARVPATLPDDVRPGDVLRLTVKEAGPERILLQVVQQPPPVATAAGHAPRGRDGARDQGGGREAGGGGARRERAVTLRYDSRDARAPRHPPVRGGRHGPWPPRARRPTRRAPPPASSRARCAHRSPSSPAGARSMPKPRHAAALSYDEERAAPRGSSPPAAASWPSASSRSRARTASRSTTTRASPRPSRACSSRPRCPRSCGRRSPRRSCGPTSSRRVRPAFAAPLRYSLTEGKEPSAARGRAGPVALQLLDRSPGAAQSSILPPRSTENQPQRSDDSPPNERRPRSRAGPSR